MQRPVRPQTGVTAPEGWDREFYDFVMSLRLKGDMKYILVKQDSNGTSVTLNLQALLDSISIPTSGGGKGGDASYNGYFKIIDVSDEDGPKVQVVDGFGWDGAGIALINDVQYTIATTTISITANSYIYLIADDVGSTPTFETFTSKQDYELGKSKTLIGRIKGKTVEGVFSITEISQEQHGAVIGFIDGDCDDDEEDE